MKVKALFPVWSIDFSEDQAADQIDEITDALAQMLTKKQAGLVAELVTATACRRHRRTIRAQLEPPKRRV